MSQSIYETITKTIIEQLESVDTKDYTKPWFNIGYTPQNAITGAEYRGINTVLLGTSPYWGSYKQWGSKGCQVKKGEKGTLCVFWKFLDGTDKQGEKTGEVIPMFKYYKVFNAEQVEDSEDGFVSNLMEKRKQELKEHDTHAESEELIKNYLTIERIRVNKADRACYSLLLDGISMPDKGQFNSIDQYYSVFFHEIAHSTGHKKRLNRQLNSEFGSKDYAKEELIAELSATFLSVKVGLEQSPRLDHAQYIKSWLQALRNDKKFIISAAQKAQKAIDFVQNANKVADIKRVDAA